MRIRVKLSICLITITAFVITGITILVLRQASGINYYKSIQNLEYLTGKRVEFWKGQEDGYIKTLHTLANLMGNFESIKAEERRDRYDDMLQAALKSEPQMVAMYTVWKPNAIDNMDNRYIGRIGSSPTGQYAIAYFKETNKITGRTSGDIESVIAHITGPNANKDRIDNPIILKVRGKNTFIVKITVPIINSSNNKVVGGLGCFLNIDAMQYILENTIKTNNEIAVIAMYSSNGTILAHSMPERIGKRMLDVDVELGDSRHEMFRAMQTGKSYTDTFFEPKHNKKIIYTMKPFQIGNSGHNWSMLIGVHESFIMKEINTITEYIIMLVLTAILITAVILFIVIVIITNPIVRTTEILKDISEGDLTRLAPERGNDEITDMSRYINITTKNIKNIITPVKQQAAGLSDNKTQTAAGINETAA